MNTVATVSVLSYLLIAAAIGGFLVAGFRRHGLLDDSAPARFTRARTLVIVMALLWPSTLLLAVIASTGAGRDWLMRVLGGDA